MMYIRCYEALNGFYVQFGPFDHIVPEGHYYAFGPHPTEDVLHLDWDPITQAFECPIEGEGPWALSVQEIRDDSVMKCAGKVLITVPEGEHRDRLEERPCQSDAEPGSDICAFHKLIAERCLECRGPLISQDGDIFCAQCGKTIPELDPADIVMLEDEELNSDAYDADYAAVLREAMEDDE